MTAADWDHLFETISFWAIFGCLPGLWIFSIGFAVLGDWRRSMATRALLTMTTDMALVLTLAAINARLGYDWPTRDFWRAIIYVALFGSVYWLLGAYIWSLKRSWHRMSERRERANIRR